MLTTVTGATGHVGGNLVRALLAEGRKLRCLVRPEDDTRAIDGLDVEIVPGDIRDAAAVMRAFAGAEVVYHLAARISIVGPEGGLVREVNVKGVENVVESCLANGVKRLVHFSSVHARKQEPLDQPVDETRTFADESAPAYDQSKAEGERRILAGVERGLNAVMVNPSGVIGPLDFAPSRMGHVFLDLAHGSLPALIGGGFDWVDVRDVARGALSAESKGRTGERYLLTGHWVAVRDLAEQWATISGVPAPKMNTPMWLARASAPFALWYAKALRSEPLFTPESLVALRANKVMRHDKAERELGYAPRPFAESLQDIYAWFVEHGDIRPKTRENA